MKFLVKKFNNILNVGFSQFNKTNKPMNKNTSYFENIRVLKTKVEFIRIKNSKFHACNLSYPNICIKTYQNPVKMPQAKTIILIGF